MKRFFQSLVSLVALVCAGCSRQNEAPRHPAEPAGSATLEQKLEILAGCGLKLRESVKPEDILRGVSRQELEGPGWQALIYTLAEVDDEETKRTLCVNLWLQDTECIEDDGDYATIARRLAEMTQGSLVLSDVKDRVDIDGNVAWVSFKVNGKAVKIDCDVENDWLDPNIITRFAELLAAADSTKTYITYDTEGQDMLIGCVTKTDLRKLNDLGIAFVALK